MQVLMFQGERRSIGGVFVLVRGYSRMFFSETVALLHCTSSQQYGGKPSPPQVVPPLGALGYCILQVVYYFRYHKSLHQGSHQESVDQVHNRYKQSSQAFQE